MIKINENFKTLTPWVFDMRTLYNTAYNLRSQLLINCWQHMDMVGSSHNRNFRLLQERLTLTNTLVHLYKNVNEKGSVSTLGLKSSTVQ